MKVINKEYNICNNLNKNIVLISDIHYSSKIDIKRLDYILENIKETKPNYICITGDITDKSQIEDEDIFIKWLKKLSNISKVIISLGNHEFYIKKNKKIFGLNNLFLNKISKINNLYLLDNKNIVIDNINFIGVTIPVEYYEDSKYFYKWINDLKIVKNSYNVLLCHSPMNLLDFSVLEEKNINLVLCGHMHGGIVFNFLRPIFKNRGIISPNKKLFPKICYGHIKLQHTNIIITSGIRVLPYKIINKLFKPEIVKINLTF